MTKTFMLAIFFEAVFLYLKKEKIFETFIMIDLHFYASFDVFDMLQDYWCWTWQNESVFLILVQ